MQIRSFFSGLSFSRFCFLVFLSCLSFCLCHFMPIFLLLLLRGPLLFPGQSFSRVSFCLSFYANLSSTSLLPLLFLSLSLVSVVLPVSFYADQIFLFRPFVFSAFLSVFLSSLSFCLCHFMPIFLLLRCLLFFLGLFLVSVFLPLSLTRRSFFSCLFVDRFSFSVFLSCLSLCLCHFTPIFLLLLLRRPPFFLSLSLCLCHFTPIVQLWCWHCRLSPKPSCPQLALHTGSVNSWSPVMPAVCRPLLRLCLPSRGSVANDWL